MWTGLLFVALVAQHVAYELEYDHYQDNLLNLSAYDYASYLGAFDRRPRRELLPLGILEDVEGEDVRVRTQSGDVIGRVCTETAHTGTYRGYIKNTFMTS